MFRFHVWPTEFRAITQPFGARPDFYGQFGLPGHEGIDFLAPEGTQVFAVAPGRVTFVQRVIGTPRTNPYGRHVMIDHGDGYRTTYAHLSETMVNMGQQVAAGDTVGLAGNTGNSQGAHLHLSLQKDGAQHLNYPNNLIDPTEFVLPFLGWQEPAGPFTAGWAISFAITVFGGLAQTNASEVSLRAEANANSERLAIIPAGTMMRVTGPEQNDYFPVLVPNAAIGIDPAPPPPEPELPPMVATVDGWGFSAGLVPANGRAVVGISGINLRAAPQRDALNIGLVRPNSTVIVRGGVSGEYTPLQVSQADFIGPINLPAVAPDPATDETILGWGFTANLQRSGTQATVGRFGINLRSAPATAATKLGMVKEGAVVRLAGMARGEYTPIHVRPVDIVDLLSPLPNVERPAPLPDAQMDAGAAPVPSPQTTAGWAFTAGIIVNGIEATTGVLGINLRAAPRRAAANLGFVPAGHLMIVTGPPQGEYTPVRVNNEFIAEPLAPTVPNNPDPQLLGSARIGLHASADPFIPPAEFEEFRLLRPGIIKVLSFHSGEDIARLAAENPQASFIVRAFLNFGGRTIGPEQFFTDTINDVRRSLDSLRGREVVVELHNEPNLVMEGLGASWQDGAEFARWWLQLLQRYRGELPGVRFIYPGLSPGADVPRVRQAHLPFIETGRMAVEAADGLGVHLYWANDFPMERALEMLDQYVRLFPTKPIWVTEASNNKGGVSPEEKARQYLRFWSELQRRPTVQGVTYFVASASNPDFAEEVWTGRGIAAILGQR